MRRRDFIASVAALGAWSESGRAQPQPQRTRKLAIIMAAGKTPEYVAAVAALEQTLGSAGWKNGENLRIDERWSAGSEDGARSAAQEVISSNPDYPHDCARVRDRNRADGRRRAERSMRSR